jgi:hypothetical protein
LLRPFLNQGILKLTIKAASQIPKHVQIEITHYNEMNDKIFDIDININFNMNVWDNARNVIKPFSFHQFHGQSNSTIYIWCYHYSLISKWKVHTDKNYNGIEMWLINHLSNRWYVIRRTNYNALSLIPSLRWSFPPQFHRQVQREITRFMTAFS